MKTDKEMMLAFQEQFNTGRLFTEKQVLVLMGYARGEEKRRAQSLAQGEKLQTFPPAAELLPECLHTQYCYMQTTDLHCMNPAGCNFKH